MSHLYSEIFLRVLEKISPIEIATINQNLMSSISKPEADSPPKYLSVRITEIKYSKDSICPFVVTLSSEWYERLDNIEIMNKPEKIHIFSLMGIKLDRNESGKKSYTSSRVKKMWKIKSEYFEKFKTNDLQLDNYSMKCLLNFSVYIFSVN